MVRVKWVDCSPFGCPCGGSRQKNNKQKLGREGEGNWERGREGCERRKHRKEVSWCQVKEYKRGEMGKVSRKREEGKKM